MLVLDRSDKVGGRCATRHFGQPPSSAPYSADYGPLFFHGSDPDFLAAFAPGERRLAFRESLNAFPQALAAGLEIRLSTRIVSLHAERGAIGLQSEAGEGFRCREVVLALVLEQARLLLGTAEKLSIEIEIDTNPPNGVRTEKRVVTRYVTFLLRHHDLPSLMAGKIAAVLTRKYTKGRDWYDLAWYLSHRPPVLLESAAQQPERLTALDMDAVARDVRPFLERPEGALLLTRGHLAGLLQV